MESIRVMGRRIRFHFLYLFGTTERPNDLVSFLSTNLNLVKGGGLIGIFLYPGSGDGWEVWWLVFFSFSLFSFRLRIGSGIKLSLFSFAFMFCFVRQLSGGFLFSFAFMWGCLATVVFGAFIKACKVWCCACFSFCSSFLVPSWVMAWCGVVLCFFLFSFPSCK